MDLRTGRALFKAFTTVGAALIVSLLLASPVLAQIPQPSGPVTFCAVQESPATAASYTLQIDGAAPAALTFDATRHAGCAATDTHSFQVPAAALTVGNHILVVRAINQFGTTTGPEFQVTVGIAPGQVRITGVIPPG